jgi:hypothetical protein
MAYFISPNHKHSTATDLKRSLGAARAREATGHSTNKAFELLRDILWENQKTSGRSMPMPGLTKV